MSDLVPFALGFLVVATFAAFLNWQERRSICTGCYREPNCRARHPHQRVAEVVRISEWKTFRQRREEQGGAA